jgi:hypothetical protein
VKRLGSAQPWRTGVSHGGDGTHTLLSYLQVLILDCCGGRAVGREKARDRHEPDPITDSPPKRSTRCFGLFGQLFAPFTAGCLPLGKTVAIQG